MDLKAFFRLNSADRVVALLLCGIVALFAYFRYVNERLARELLIENNYLKQSNEHKDSLIYLCNEKYNTTLKDWIRNQDKQLLLLNSQIDKAIINANSSIYKTNKIIDNAK